MNHIFRVAAGVRMYAECDIPSNCVSLNCTPPSPTPALPELRLPLLLLRLLAFCGPLPPLLLLLRFLAAGFAPPPFDGLAAADSPP